MRRNEIIGLSAAVAIFAGVLASLILENVINTAQAIESTILFVLVCVTAIYTKRAAETADAAKQQAEASVKMAEETREQRYAALKPIIDIVEMQMEPMELAKQAYGVREGNFPQGLPCRLRNIGVGPALNVYSPIEDAGGEPRQWNFGVIPIAIGEEEMGYTHKKRLFLEQRDDHEL